MTNCPPSFRLVGESAAPPSPGNRPGRAAVGAFPLFYRKDETMAAEALFKAHSIIDTAHEIGRFWSYLAAARHALALRLFA